MDHNKEVSKKKQKQLIKEQENRLSLAKNANEIKKQGDLIRDLKAKTEDKNAPEILEEVFKLLSLKLHDPELKTQAIKNFSNNSVFKLRWKIRKDDGTIERLQNVFSDIPSFTAEEIGSIISSYTLKDSKFPHLGGFTKIEVVITKENNDKKNEIKGVYKALRPTDRVQLPLLFPGPTFPDLHVQDFRVTWSIAPTIQNTPKDYPKIRPYLVDIGVNLFDKELNHNINTVVYNANASGVVQLIAISTNLSNCVEINLPLCRRYVNSVFATIGIHPNEINTWNENTEKQIEDVYNENKQYFIGIGECGLDFIKEDISEEEKKKQEFLFEKQLQIASKYKIPVFLHERKAHKQFVDILSKYRSQLPSVLINCFTGPISELDAYNKLDCYIGVTGILASDDRGENLRTVLKDIPSNRLVLGSDAPYLTPFNMPRDDLGRFPKCNEPQYLPFTLSLAASLLNTSVEHLAHVTTQNARNLFRLPELLYNGTSRSDVKKVH